MGDGQKRTENPRGDDPYFISLTPGGDLRRVVPPLTPGGDLRRVIAVVQNIRY